MASGDKNLTQRLQKEMEKVAFSSEQKAVLRSKLARAMHDNDLEREQKSLLSKLRRFWSGTTEIPLPVAVAAMALLAFGVGGHVAEVYVVDQSTALLLLQAGNETVKTLHQGVSLL